MPKFENINLHFKKRLIAKEPLAGAFVKTPHPIIVEVMARSGYDMLVLDGEHGPFDKASIDTAICVGRAHGCAMLVRIASHSPEHVSFVLDAGAAGVMIPHVNTAKQARKLVRAARYGHNGRGFAGTTRAAHYADRSMQQHIQMSANETTIIAQIEEPEGVANCKEIATIEGIDALFVGRADLAVSIGSNDFFASNVAEMTNTVLNTANIATGLYCAPNEDLHTFAQVGASIFVEGSDHSALRTAAQKTCASIRALVQS